MTARIVITGDVNRPGQELNILRLYGLLAPVLHAATGQLPEYVIGEGALPFEEWVAGYFTGPFPVTTNDHVCIGFELPPCAKRILRCWVDVRVHPHRWDPGCVRWSLRSDMPHVERAAERHRSPVWPPTTNDDHWPNTGVFACQVHNDAALLVNDAGRGRFVSADEVTPGLLEWGQRQDVVFVTPHPLEPSGPWAGAVLERLPQATPAPRARRTYDLLRRVEHCCTLSSSVGFEASSFGAKSEFLMQKPEISEPVDIRQPELWRAILEGANA